ncbi:CPBP family intramembrane metalloprotease [Halosimplex rubrum]|uniref:CPBP family intramembrane metalloprotease n=1 Tax=Halosimplex rubrum TaxID=869889 RepID=A0A7D5T2G5_9EURY|nr:CPBP family intramembrane glutamic endopeptidase [Halosimplex rubrum]QLH79828.1 CPBP family intramembrane metalloprotease [Halosimplex rubrum]
MVLDEIATTGWQVVTTWVAQIRSGDPGSLLLAWALVGGCKLLLIRILPTFHARVRLLCRDDGLRTDRSGERSSEPSPVTTAQLKEAEAANTQVTVRDLLRALDTVVLVPIIEEILFRGIPVVASRRASDSTAVLLLVSIAATAGWASLHVYFGRTPYILPHLLSGLFLLYLWLHGQGDAAIALHMLTNLVVVLARVARRFVRVAHPNILAPGEEYWVTVAQHTEPSYGLYSARTSDGQQLRVTDVTPGETYLVRVATVGRGTMAYPLRAAETVERSPRQCDDEG